MGLAKGESLWENAFGAIKASIFGSEGAADWEEDDDSAALGLPKVELKGEVIKQLKGASY